MRISEIFFSIQGESSHAGKPCVFVRLTGCSLRCGYCDTKYSYAGGQGKSREKALGPVGPYRRSPVELTAGGPLDREAANPLWERLPKRATTLRPKRAAKAST